MLGSSNNPQSWQNIHNFIDEFPEDEYWSNWKSMARDLVFALEARGLSKCFRVGQSMHQIIFSTSPRHGLITEPRVTLEFYPNERQVRIAYSHANVEFCKPDSVEQVDVLLASSCALRYLRQLWVETYSETEIPKGLTTG